MSLTTPTTQSISDNIIAQLQSSLGQTIPFLPKSFMRVLAKVLAGVFVLLYKYGGFIFQQMFVATASNSPTEINGKTVIPLQAWGELVGVGLPNTATSAEMIIDINVEILSGTLPAGTQLINTSNGVTYLTETSVLLDSAVKQVTIKASADQSGGDGSGAIGNLQVGDIVAFANPLANVARNATVSSIVTVGADGESTESYRYRVVERFQKLPQGGAYTDYELWGEDVAGVAHIYPYTSNYPGQVDVYVEATTAIDADGIPPAALLQAVLDAIELNDAGLATRRPANALVNTLPITRKTFDVNVASLVVSDLAIVQAQILTALTEYFLDKEPYIVGLSVPPRRDRITASAISGIVDDIVSANEGVFSGVSVNLGVIPINIYSLNVGEKAKLGTLTYI